MADDKFTIKVGLEIDEKSTYHKVTKQLKDVEKKVGKQKGKTSQETYQKFKTSEETRTQKQKERDEAREKKQKATKEKKLHNFREKTEKFRLNETKKLMREGMSFEKARKTAFKKSLMSQKELRDLEYKKIKKEGVYSLRQQLSQVGKQVFMGSFLGGIMSTGASGLLNFAIQSALKKSEEAKLERRGRYAYTEKEQNKILEHLGDSSEFNTPIKKINYFNTTGGLKYILRSLGIENVDKADLEAHKAITTLIESGSMGLQEAYQAVTNMITGNFQQAYQAFGALGLKSLNETKAKNLEISYKHDRTLGFRELERVMAESKAVKESRGYTEYGRGEKMKEVIEARNVAETTIDNLQDLLGQATTKIIKFFEWVLKWFTNPKEAWQEMKAFLWEGATGLASGIGGFIGAKIKAFIKSIIPTSILKFFVRMGYLDKSWTEDS